MEKVISEIQEFISSHDNYLLTTHQNADGDAYASVLSMAYYLRQLGKTYQIVIHDQDKDTKYQYLWGWDKITSYPLNQAGAAKELGTKFDCAIILDVPSKSRIGNPSELLPPPENCIKIDHHPEEEKISHINLVDTSASSTCQLIYEVFERANIKFDFDLANLIFCGIMYDTGRFSFSNTRQRDFEIGAHLLQFGVKPHDVANRLFFSSSFESMRIIGIGLSEMEVHLDGKLCIIFLPLSVMQNNNHSEIEELANYSVAIKGSEVGLFIRETKPKFFKVSFRSRGTVNVNKVAKTLGGGGHEHAAGCRYEGEYNDLKQKLISEVGKQLK
jgi:phosphoesterase RecJ-like protein